MAELRGLGEINAELEKRGGQLLAIAVDPPKDAANVVEKNNLPFPVLCDTERKVIQAYSLVHPGAGPGGSDVAMPAHILIDQSGKIRWKYVAHRVHERPYPEEILEQIRKLETAG
jgi:peroxiredoxin